MSQLDPGGDVRVERWYAASPDTVFRTFTEPALIERWFCPRPDVTVQVLSLDLRVGGAFRFLFNLPEGPRPVVGEYRTIVRPHRLVFIWTWEPPDRHAGVETLVTVVFAESRGGTALSLTHERFPDEPTKRAHEIGWDRTLERLDQFLTAHMASFIRKDRYGDDR